MILLKGVFHERSFMTYKVVKVTAQLLLLLSLLLLPSSVMSIMDDTDDMRSMYGVDVSFPMHHPFEEFDDTEQIMSQKKEQPLGDRNQFYHNYMQGCRDKFDGGNRHGQCDHNERGRIALTLSQPKKMTNYTDIGFKKIKAPKKSFDLLQQFWDANHKDNEEVEEWGPANVFTNHWDVPTYFIDTKNFRYPHGGGRLAWEVERETKAILEDWTGQKLKLTSLYGIRVYKEGAVLSPHVDRHPLISSAIINVAQDVDEAWPIEVIGHDGKAYNITMEPGDMVLYESHSIIHGRPFALKGRYFANVFVHFMPVPMSTDQPPKIKNKDPLAAHVAAKNGNLKDLMKMVKTSKELLFNSKDENGWSPIHEGARSGHKEIIDFLLEHGADINDQTKYGETVLYLAREEFGRDAPFVKHLEDLGAQLIRSEL